MKKEQQLKQELFEALNAKESLVYEKIIPFERGEFKAMLINGLPVRIRFQQTQPDYGFDQILNKVHWGVKTILK